MKELLIKEYRQIQQNNDITTEMICSTISAFAENLPYSMDPLSTKFVHSILLNVIPNDADNYWCFKGSEDPTLFKELKNWNDTRKSAYSLMICSLLQNMLLGGKCEMAEDIEQTTKIWGLSEKDSEIMKECILSLPKHCDKILNSKTISERENTLQEAYNTIKKNFGAWRPSADLSMYYYFHNLNFPKYELEEKDNPYDNNALESKIPKLKIK